MLAIETEMDDSDRLVSSLVMVTDRGRADTDNLLAKEVKERTEPKKKPQAYNNYKYQILNHELIITCKISYIITCKYAETNMESGK